MKIYFKSIFIFLKDIFTCSDMHTTNIFITENYYELLLISKINHKSIFVKTKSLRNLIEDSLYFVFVDSAMYVICDIYFNHIYNYF